MYEEWYEQPKRKPRRNHTLRKVRKEKKDPDDIRHLNYTQLYNVQREFLIQC